ncbi:MAG TPA: two-component regulator propeller domain-containing protein [Pyrinomonadaceae bacterium]|nr:two-component regulator propeller domain-containing protein [Pyrinomonadaceae bacterium]
MSRSVSARRLTVGALSLFLLLLLCRGWPSFALDPRRELADYSRNVWLTENGLPQNTVNAVAQTADGYLWIGTGEGVARFDGTGFTVFDKQNTPELKNNDVRALAGDRRGGLWLGTSTGLLRLAEGKFSSFTTREGLAGDDVQAIFEDREGGVWVATPAGLSRFKDGSFTNWTTRDGLVSNDVKALYEDGERALWVGTSDGLGRLKDGEFTSYTVPDGLASNSVSSVAQDRAGRLWVGTFKGLSSLSEGKFKTYTVADGLPSDRITALRVDAEGTLWVGTSNGLSRYRDERFTSFEGQGELSRSVILSVYEDREGSLWVGTESAGLTFLKDKKFTTYSAGEGLPNELVKCVYEDREGAVWMGTYGGGLSRLKNGTMTNFTTRDGLSSDFVLALADDAEGNLWVGTPDGLNRLRDGKFTTYTSADGLANDFVRSIRADRDGTLWVGTRGGLTRLKDGGFTIYTTEDGLADNFVGAIYEDRAGALWVGTLRGLSRFKDGKFTTYTTRDGLSSDTVISLYEDASGDSLWVGTSGGGMNRLRDGKFTAYTVQAGLLDDEVYSIMEDEKQDLWLSCNKGVFRVDRRQLDDFAAGKIGTIEPIVYGTADGMRTRECSGGGHPSGWKGRDGRLWFSTLKGVAVLDPARLKVNARPPGVVIEQVRIDDESVAPSSRIELPPGKSRFDFYYAGLSFVAPEKVRFKYKLDGFDEDWIDGGTRRVAYYTNLPPGEYKFRVMAANNDGVWNEAGASLDLYLKPHFYQTYWFYALSAAALALAVWQLYLLRVRQVKRRFAAVLDERNRIAREIHDNLAQEILGISIQLELVSRTMAKDAEATKSHLDRARLLVRNSIAEARRYIWDLRSQALENNDLPSALTETARRLTAETNVQAQVEVSGTFRPLNELIESNLLRISQEAINNAVRHAEAQRILINLKFDARRVQLSVRDNGRGFDAKAEGRNGHYGLVGMRERAEQMGGTLFVESAPGEGTEVMVEVPLAG